TRHTHSTSYYFFLTDPAPPDTYTLSLHDALPICADLSSFLPARRESGACGAPLAFVPALPAIDAGRKIRQPHREPRRGHREQALRVEREEPDPRPLPRVGDVGAEVELVEIGQRRRSPQPSVAQREGRHRDPAAAVALVDREPAGHLGAQRLRRDA